MKIHIGTENITFISVKFHMKCLAVFCSQIPVVLLQVLNSVFKIMHYFKLTAGPGLPTGPARPEGPTSPFPPAGPFSPLSPAWPSGPCKSHEKPVTLDLDEI